MTYTQLAISAATLSVVIDVFVARTRLVTRRSFWVSYVILLGFQLLTNGVLTGLRVVRYDPQSIVGGTAPKWFGDGRFIFAPVEDIVFGFALITLTLVSWVWWGRRGLQRTPASGPPRWRASSGRSPRDDGTRPRR